MVNKNFKIELHFYFSFSGNAAAADDDKRKIESICKRNTQIQPSLVHARILDIVVAMSPLELPPYVLLEIVNQFRYWKKWVPREEKINLIISIDKSCKRIQTLKKNLILLNKTE